MDEEHQVNVHEVAGALRLEVAEHAVGLEHGDGLVYDIGVLVA